jgi:hypothetical protein
METNFEEIIEELEKMQTTFIIEETTMRERLEIKYYEEENRMRM